MGRLAAVLLKPFARDGYLRRMPPPFGNWTKYRDFPRPRPHNPRAREPENPPS